MSAAAAAERGRRLAESLMTSTCSIAPPGSEPVTDPETGAVTFPAGVAVYSGKCRVRPADAQGTTADAGGAELFVFDYLVSIPFDAEGSPDVRERMRCRILTSPDPSLVGVDVEIRKVPRGDTLTARRLLCNEVA